MSERVLSTAMAESTIKTMQQLINGPLVDDINRLNAAGQTLSDPLVWDGRLAQEFRQSWPETHQRLMSMRESLEQLREQIETINRNIMTAGGNR